MLNKLIFAVFLSVFSISCFAKTTYIQCEKPTHTPGSPWKAPAGWEVVSGEGPDNKWTQVPDEITVTRECQDGWSSNSLICTYKFSADQELKIKHDFDGSVTDTTQDQSKFSQGYFRYSSSYCDTKAKTPEQCRVESRSGHSGITLRIFF